LARPWFGLGCDGDLTFTFFLLDFLGLRSLVATAMGATGSAYQKRFFESFYLSMPYLHMTCSVCWTSLCTACFS